LADSRCRLGKSGADAVFNAPATGAAAIATLDNIRSRSPSVAQYWQRSKPAHGSGAGLNTARAKPNHPLDSAIGRWPASCRGALLELTA
jgi:hypothetical protein